MKLALVSSSTTAGVARRGEEGVSRVMQSQRWMTAAIMHHPHDFVFLPPTIENDHLALDHNLDNVTENQYFSRFVYK